MRNGFRKSSWGRMSEGGKFMMRFYLLMGDKRKIIHDEG
jgi:hypothetical protein